MINNFRKELTERFIEVFNDLVRDGVIEPHQRNGKGIKDVAKILFGDERYGHLISSILKKERFISYENARDFCEAFGVNINYLTDGILPRYTGEFTATEKLIIPDPRFNVVFTNMVVRADGREKPIDNSYKEKFEYAFIPGLKGNDYYALGIEGDSMEPEFFEGETIICRQVEAHDIKNNGTYVVAFADGALLKKVQKKTDEFGKPTSLTLFSSNYLKYPPIERPFDRFTKLFKVVQKISVVA